MAEEKKEYWRWLESRWNDPNTDWSRAEIITGGVDVGSVSSQAVILTDGELYAYSSLRTGSDSPDSARRAMDWALEGTGLKLDSLQYIIGTGYGRTNVPFANRVITEISCHALGGNRMYGPSLRTLLDMGGQDCKTIHCNEKGKVTDFLMNDKCAAGTGRGMEVFADLLAIPITEIGQASLEIDQEPPPVASTCVVFAKGEATGLLEEGWSENMVLAAYTSAMVHRIVELLERGGIEREFAVTGGIAKNIGVVKRIEDAIGMKGLTSKYDTQIAGALGAALFAHALEKKGRS